MKRILLIASICICSIGYSQIDQSNLGGWYMYFFKADFKKSGLGVQGDIQYRNWNVMGDLEQLLLRGGVTYSPKEAKIKFTLGYGHVFTGAYGPSDAFTQESRIYQEALYPLKIGSRVYLNNRFRFEQRWVEGQKFRTRYRFNLFMNIPFNHKEMTDKTVYLALYNEIFVNGQKDIGNGNSVSIFDRNRLYYGIGYIFKKGLKIQFGAMHQRTNSWGKHQLQFSFHHTIKSYKKKEEPKEG